MCVCAHVCFYLKRLNKGPEKDANSFALPEELDKTSSPEESQKTQIDEVILQKERQTNGQAD